jgi:hypothetical protein
MDSFIKHYGVGVFSFFITILTAVQTMNHFGVIDILQVAALAVSTFVVIIVPLLKGGWAGGLKTGLDLLGGAIVIAIPFVGQAVAGTSVTGPQIVIMVLAFLKVAATEFGVQIRTDWGATPPSALTDVPGGRHASVAVAVPVTSAPISSGSTSGQTITYNIHPSVDPVTVAAVVAATVAPVAVYVPAAPTAVETPVLAPVVDLNPAPVVSAFAPAPEPAPAAVTFPNSSQPTPA